MAQIPGRPTQVGSAVQTQSLTIAETPNSHHNKLPCAQLTATRLEGELTTCATRIEAWTALYLFDVPSFWSFTRLRVRKKILLASYIFAISSGRKFWPIDPWLPI